MLGVEIDDGLTPCGKLRADAYPIAAPSQTTADPGRAGGYGHRDLVVGEMRTLFVAGVLLTLSAPAIAAEIHTCFTPGEDCTGLVVSEIAAVRSEVLVQAYSFTSPPIVKALVRTTLMFSRSKKPCWPHEPKEWS